MSLLRFKVSLECKAQSTTNHPDGASMPAKVRESP